MLPLRADIHLNVLNNSYARMYLSGFSAFSADGHVMAVPPPPQQVGGTGELAGTRRYELQSDYPHTPSSIAVQVAPLEGKLSHLEGELSQSLDDYPHTPSSIAVQVCHRGPLSVVCTSIHMCSFGWREYA